MNTYRQSRDIQPFLLERSDLDLLWSLLLKLLPKGEATHEWRSVSTDLERVQVEEGDLDSFLGNPELPETLSSFAVAVHKNFDSNLSANTYSIRISLQRSSANVVAVGPDEAWAIGTVETVLGFFQARKRPFGRFVRVVTRTAPFMLIAPSGAFVAMSAVAALEGNRQLAILGLITVLALASASALLLLAHGGEVTRIRLAGSTRSWSATFVVAVVACGFTILTFVVAVLQLLGS